MDDEHAEKSTDLYWFSTTETNRGIGIGRILLEVATLFYFLARSATIPIVQEYIYYLVWRKYNETNAGKNGTVKA